MVELVITINFTIDIMFYTEWYYHMLSVFAQLCITWFDMNSVLLLLIEVVIYSNIELAFKRNWVLRDSSKKSESFFLSTFDMLPLGAFIVDKSNNFLFFNQRGEKMLRNKGSTHFPKTFVEIVSQKDHERISKTIEKIIEGKYHKF